MLAFEDVVCRFHVLQSAVGTAADHDLIDLHIMQFACRACIFRQVRTGNGGHDCTKVNVVCLFVFRIGVRFKHNGCALASAVHIGYCLLVHREDAVLGARFNGHIANAQTVIHGKALHAFTDKFHALVQRTVHTDPADNGQDDVLAAAVGGKLSHQVKTNGRGNLEPSHTGRHACGHVCAADAGGKCTEGTVGTGVAVCADNAVARCHNPLFGKQCVLNAHLAHIVEVADAVTARKFTAGLGLLGSLDVLVGNKVVENDCNSVLIEYVFKSRFFKFIDRNRRCDVVA